MVPVNARTHTNQLAPEPLARPIETDTGFDLSCYLGYYLLSYTGRELAEGVKRASRGRCLYRSVKRDVKHFHRTPGTVFVRKQK